MTRWFLFGLIPFVVGFSPSDPAWIACDRLDGSMPRAGALWVSADLASWDAMPGSMATRISAGCEPESGGGLRLAWRTLAWPDGTMRDLEGALVWRESKWRGDCALGRATFKDQHATRCSPRLLVAVSPHLVAGGSITFFPGVPGGAPEFEIEARSAAGPWCLGLVLHENASEAAVGIEARPGLAVIARYANDVPALGMVLDTRVLEFRAEAEDHPLLGRIARVAVRLMRGRS